MSNQSLKTQVTGSDPVVSAKLYLSVKFTVKLKMRAASMLTFVALTSVGVTFHLQHLGVFFRGCCLL